MSLRPPVGREATFLHIMMWRWVSEGVLVAALAACSGCAAMPPAQVGQTAGTVIGAVVAPGIGAPIGSLVGLLAGMLVQGQVDQATERRERRELGEQLAAESPAAAEEDRPPVRGQPTRVWVDEAVKDGRVIPGHFDICEIP